MKHDISLRGKIWPRQEVKYTKNWIFLHLIPHPPIILLMIDRKQCRLKEKIIFVDLRNCGTSLSGKIGPRRGFNIKKVEIFSFYSLSNHIIIITIISLLIQSECRKIWTRKISVFGHFSRSDNLSKAASLWVLKIGLEATRQLINNPNLTAQSSFTYSNLTLGTPE